MPPAIKNILYKTLLREKSNPYMTTTNIQPKISCWTGNHLITIWNFGIGIMYCDAHVNNKLKPKNIPCKGVKNV